MAGPADHLNRQIKKPYRLRNKLSGNRHGFYGICVLFLAVAHQLLQLIEKALHIRELAVDGGKADIRHLVHLS